MDTVWIWMGALAVALVLCYLLYTKGQLSVSAKTAVVYVESPPFGTHKRRITARFSACHGMTKRAIALESGKDYRFSLDANLKKGIVTVEVQNRQQETVLTLRAANPTGVLYAEEKRYFVKVNFIHADGTYTLCWDAQ